jgi:hypothetical protein
VSLLDLIFEVCFHFLLVPQFLQLTVLLLEGPLVDYFCDVLLILSHLFQIILSLVTHFSLYSISRIDF